MKHVSKLLILSVMLIFAATAAFGQQEVVIDNITNSVNNDTLIAGSSHTISMRIRNLISDACASATFNPNMGFAITSPDGASWNSSTGAFAPAWSAIGFTQEFVNHFEDPLPGGDGGGGPNDGISPDYIAFAGVSFSATGGLPVPFDDIAMTIDIETNLADSNLTICIDTSSLGRLNTFAWAGIARAECNVVPTFNQHCMTIFDVPNIAPVCTDPTTTITGSHCDAFSHQFSASDAEGDPITWSLGAGSPGSITPGGMWTWNMASLNDVGASVTVTAIPSDNKAGTPCVVNVVVTNETPVITCPAAGVTVQTGDTKSQQVTATDDPCDNLTYSIVDAGGAAGAVSVDANGLVTYSPADPADANLAQPVVMTVEVSDGLASAQCTIEWNVIAGAPFTSGMSDDVAVPGTFSTVDISLGAIDVNAGLGGFDLKIGFDQSALSFQRADRGQIYTDCGWEYFTYRVVDAGTVHLIGMADQNDGPNHPGCAAPTPYVNTLPVSLATMTFLTSNNGGLNGMCVAIRHLWQDCGDNILSDAAGEALLAAKVFDAGNAAPISDPSASLPTFLGMPQSCADATTAQRQVDYTNGRLCFGTGAAGGLRGDINVNGLPNEIADGVMFTNFFISGLSAFAGHVNESIAASDANADGLTLTVADLVYLIRVIVGDAPAIPKVNPVVATYTVDKNVVRVNDGVAMGAAHVVIKGEVLPELLADNMDIAYGYDGENTNVLVYSLNRDRQSFEGEFLRTNGEVLSVELATFDGAPVAAKAIPANYALAQNYPNPFNPSTVISMSLPLAGDYNLTVYNVTGQVVAEFNGTSEAGIVEIEWDASNLASGVYFYKMLSGEFTATKKAVLLK